MDQENVAMSSGGHLVVIHAVDLSSPLTVLPLYEYKCSMYDSICKTHVYIRMYPYSIYLYLLSQPLRIYRVIVRCTNVTQ